MSPEERAAAIRAVLKSFIESFTKKQLHILRKRVLSPSPPTQTRMATQLRVSRQRVSQVESRVRQSVADWLRTQKGSPIRERANALATLGSAIPWQSPVLATALGQLEDDFGTSVGSPGVKTGEFFLFAAGPYRMDGSRMDGSWLLKTQDEQQLSDLEESVRSRSDERGVASADAVAEVLEPLVHPDFHAQWMSERTSFFFRDGVGYIDGSAGLVKKAEQALRRMGRPATLSELQREMRTDYNPRYAMARLAGSHTTKRVTKNKFGLREWGGHEYASVSDAIAQEIAACQGVATLDHLCRVLSERFEVAASSVASLAMAPRFAISGRDVRLRDRSAPYHAPRSTLEKTARCYRHGAGWAVRLRVDRDMVRGSGRSCPEAFAHLLGVAVGARRKFRCGNSSVTIAWNERSSTGPYFGSMRKLARELGAEVGDWIFVTEEGGEVGAWRLPNEAVRNSEGLSRAALLAGACLPGGEAYDAMQAGGPGAAGAEYGHRDTVESVDDPWEVAGDPWEEKARRSLARAVALPADATCARIAAALLDRSEGQLAALLPNDEQYSAARQLRSSNRSPSSPPQTSRTQRALSFSEG